MGFVTRIGVGPMMGGREIRFLHQGLPLLSWQPMISVLLLVSLGTNAVHTADCWFLMLLA